MSSLRTRQALFAIAAFVSLSACREKQEALNSVPPTAAAVPSTKPVDHLASNELVEGTTVVLDFKLPRVARVERSLGTVVSVKSSSDILHLADYVERHTKDAKITRLEHEVTFDNAHVPANPSRVLKVVVYARRDGESGAAMTIFDNTPGPSGNFASDEERLRSVGLNANGKVLDPKTLE